MRQIGLVLMLLLVGCQTKQGMPTHDERRNNKPTSVPITKASSKALDTKDQRDGAPTGPIPTSFKKAVPASEPYSRYGNPPSYRVNGQAYHVMTSSSGYRARGIASWYGTKFHQRRTSSGEEYDLYALTAAHKTLPLPTYVKVKNLSNGRELIVKVNDRGPFHSDRIIDLSYGAALELGLMPKGTAPVEIEALTVKGAINEPAHYYLQAGAFQTQQFAHEFQEKLAKMTPSPVFIEKYNPYFVVKVGPFASKQMADKLKGQLADNGVKGAFSLLQ